MDSTIIASIIGGATTLAAVIITPIVKNLIEDKKFYPISKDRRSTLTGKWEGLVRQNLKENDERSFNVQLNIKVKGRRIIGTGVISSDNMHHVELEGSFRNDRFLKMDYRNNELGVVQFGSFVFQLSGDSRQLQGLFVGYGHLSESIIHGDCLFNKK